MADAADRVTDLAELDHMVNLRLSKKQGAALPPKCQCYGCMADFTPQEHGPEYAKLLFCPESAEECEGYYRQDQWQRSQR